MHSALLSVHLVTIPSCGIIQRMFWQERALGTLQTLHATDEGPTFCRVRAALTATIKVPFLLDLPTSSSYKVLQIFPSLAM